MFEVVVANIVACCRSTKQSAKVSNALESTSLLRGRGVSGEITNIKVPSVVIFAAIMIFLIKLCYRYLLSLTVKLKTMTGIVGKGKLLGSPKRREI